MTSGRPHLWVAASLLGLAAAWVLPAWLAGSHALLGADGSDAIRAAWGFDHVLRGLPDPIWTRRIHFPSGATALPLPFFSALLLAPADLLFGPFAGYTLAIVLLLWLAGAATAWAVRELTGSWSIGAMAGATFMAQPMLLHAIDDGTPEHLAIWTLPACWAAILRALRTGSSGWSAVAGALAVGLALDSPYGLVFGLVMVPFLLPLLATRLRQADRHARLRSLLPALLITTAGLLLVYWLYSGFTLQPPDTALDLDTALAGNSVDLRAWWMQENRPEADILGTLAPALIPTAFLISTLILSVLGLPRSLPWLLAALFSLGLALGTNPQNAGVLAWWGQAAAGGTGHTIGQHLGELILAFNTWWTRLPLMEGVRFPRRWLVLAGLALCVAGGVGLAAMVPLSARGLKRLQDLRIGPKGPTLAGILLGITLSGGMEHDQHYRDHLPTMELPTALFARWLGEEAPPGAVILFPTVRPAPDMRVRARVPVYANLGTNLASADHEYFQLLHHRPTHHHPSLLTVLPSGDPAPAIARLLQDTNDLTVPHFLGGEPPGSATDPRRDAERAAGRHQLRQAGTCCLAFDLGVYEEPWLQRAVQFYAPIHESHRFEEGDGVLVVVME